MDGLREPLDLARREPGVGGDAVDGELPHEGGVIVVASGVGLDVRGVDPAALDQDARDAVEQRLVRLGPQRQVLRGLHGGLGEPRVDDDDGGVVGIAEHALPQDGVRDARVRADEHDDVRLLEVAVGVGRRVEPERLLVGDDRRRHALPRVPVAVQHAHTELGEGAEQGQLLGGHLAGAEERQRPGPVAGLDRLEPLDHRPQGRVPAHRPPGGVAGLAQERGGGAVRRV